ncbi:Large neutral amino acids transporter small subunit 2 [Bulinus truncatus]|nr:Large neutral amino acids transporter small subunit 2 [Bulinus truncatus]
MSKRRTGLFGNKKSSSSGVTVTSFTGLDNGGYINSEDLQPKDSSGIAVISEGIQLPNGQNGNVPSESGILPSGDLSPNEAALNGSAHGVQKQMSTVEMKRSINLLHCTAIMVAVTGHSSIFVSPSSIMAETGSVGSALIVWLIGGLINVGTALCFAELGTMYPKAGGPYSYTMKSFGPLMGFLIMWGYTVLIAGPFWAFLANTAALYIVKPGFPNCLSGDVKTAVNILAGWIMITLVVLNCVYMKYVTKVQTLLSASKILVLLIIIVSGIYNLAIGRTENFEAPFENTTREPGRFAVAIFYSIFSYGGWQVMTTLLEEVKDPSRDPPRSVYISFAIVISKYIMANVAYVTLMTPAEVIGSSAVASDFINRMYSPLVPLVSVFVALTSIGALNASIMGHSRLLFAGARNGHMPQILGMVHAKYLTPWPSIFVYLAWGLVMLFTGGVTDMMDFIALFSTIMAIVVIAALLYLRWTKPDETRPYKTLTAIPVVELIVNVAVLVLAIYQKPNKMGIGLAILFAGVPVYWFGVMWKNKPKEFTDIVDSLTAFAQKLFQLTKVKK